MAIKSKKPTVSKKLEKAIPKKPAVKPQDKPNHKTKVVAKPAVKSPAKAPSRPKKGPLVRKLPPPKPKKLPKMVAEPAVEKPKKSKVRKKPAVPKVTTKERILVKSMIDGKNMTEAAKAAGVSRTFAYELIEKPQVQEAFHVLLDRAGLTDSKLADKIRHLSDAKDVKFFSHNGIVLDERKFPALEVQRKTIEMACKMKGHLVDRNELTGPDGGPIQVGAVVFAAVDRVRKTFQSPGSGRTPPDLGA